MTRVEQVCTLEQAKRLQELGCEHPTITGRGGNGRRKSSFWRR